MSAPPAKVHCPEAVEDDLVIGADGAPSALNGAAQARLARSPGSWKLLGAPSDLLLALRGCSGGLLPELAGLNADAAVLAGDLAEMQPSDLLNFLHQGRRTGVLLTRVGEVERAVVLIEGNIAWANSTSPGERLGELLARMGLAERARIEAALAAQGAARGHRRLGQLLVEKGVLAADEVLRGLRHQVVEIFLGLLVARSGSFVFLRGVDREALPTSLGLDTQAMLLDGLRRLDELELYRSLVPGVDVQPRPGGKPPDGDGLSSEARQVLALADGRRTLATIAAATALGEFEATKATYKLIAAGYLQL